MTSDVIVALAVAEPYLEKGDWVRIHHDKVTRPTWVHIGTIHTNGLHEQHHTSYMIKHGVAVKHSGI